MEEESFWWIVILMAKKTFIFTLGVPVGSVGQANKQKQVWFKHIFVVQ